MPGRVALVVLIAAVAGIFSAYRLDVSGARLEPKTIEFGAASTTLLVDAADTPIVDSGRAIDGLALRAPILGGYALSASVKEQIARVLGRAPADFNIDAQTLANLPSSVTAVREEQRAEQLRVASKRWSVLVKSGNRSPLIDLYAKAPTGADAVALADATADALSQLIADTQARQGVPRARRVILRQLGPPEGETVNAGAPPVAAALVGLAVLLLGLALLLLVGARGERQLAVPGAPLPPEAGA